MMPSLDAMREAAHSRVQDFREMARNQSQRAQGEVVRMWNDEDARPERIRVACAVAVVAASSFALLASASLTVKTLLLLGVANLSMKVVVQSDDQLQNDSLLKILDRVTGFEGLLRANPQRWERIHLASRVFHFVLERQ